MTCPRLYELIAVVGSALSIPKGEKVPAALIEKLVSGRVRQTEKKKRAWPAS